MRTRSGKTQATRPKLVVVHGAKRTGKTTLVNYLREAILQHTGTNPPATYEPGRRCLKGCVVIRVRNKPLSSDPSYDVLNIPCETVIPMSEISGGPVPASVDLQYRARAQLAVETLFQS